MRLALHLRLFLYLTVALALSFCLSLHFFVEPLRPWSDQGSMLQAALRHAHGQGLTTQFNAQSRDLTRPAFERLVYFPPGYPLAVSTMLRAGFEIETAVKIINAVAIAAGMAGWLFLALPLLEDRALRVLYCALLVLACGGIITKGGTTDVVFWAGVPWWIVCLLRARDAVPNRAAAFATAAACINAVLISVRWAAAFLVPVAVVALLFPLRRERIRTAFLVALPPTLMYLAIGAINRHYSSAANVLSFTQSGWRPRFLLTLYPFESLFAVPLGLEPLLGRIWRAIDPSMHFAWGSALFRVAMPLLLIIILLASVRRPIASPALAVIALLGAGLIAFLAWMSLRYNWDFVDWSFLREPRYYRPFLPAFLLAWLILLDRAPAVRRRWFAALLALSSLYLLQAAARMEWSMLRTHDESLDLVVEVRGLASHRGLNVVFDVDISDVIIHPDPNLIANLYPAETELAHHHIGRPATLWLVRRVREPTAYLIDRDSDRRSFDAMRQRFGAKRAWISSAGSYEIWSASVAP